MRWHLGTYESPLPEQTTCPAHSGGKAPGGDIRSCDGGQGLPKGSSELRPHLRLAGQEPQGGLRPLGPLLSRVERVPLGPYLES